MKKIIINNFKKIKKTTKLQRKQNELNKERALLRKQNESNKEIKQNEKKMRKKNSGKRY